MHGNKIADRELKSLFLSASKIAARYGRIGLSEPDDIVQETMLKVLAKNDGRNASIAWLRAVLRNTVIDQMRAATREFRNRVSEVERDDDGRTWLDCASSTGYQREFSEFDVLPNLKEKLDAMTPALRKVLVLHVEGYSYEEIAAITLSKVGTVRSRLFYARKKAQALMQDLR